MVLCVLCGWLFLDFVFGFLDVVRVLVLRLVWAGVVALRFGLLLVFVCKEVGCGFKLPGL